MRFGYIDLCILLSNFEYKTQTNFIYCGHDLIPTTQLPHDNHTPNEVVDPLVGEHEIKTSLQHDNFHEGVKVNEENYGNFCDLCIEVPPTKEEHPPLAQGRYFFLKQKCPQLDEYPLKRKANHLSILISLL